MRRLARRRLPVVVVLHWCVLLASVDATAAGVAAKVPGASSTFWSLNFPCQTDGLGEAPKRPTRIPYCQRRRRVASNRDQNDIALMATSDGRGSKMGEATLFVVGRLRAGAAVDDALTADDDEEEAEEEAEDEEDDELDNNADERDEEIDEEDDKNGLEAILPPTRPQAKQSQSSRRNTNEAVQETERGQAAETAPTAAHPTYRDSVIRQYGLNLDDNESESKSSRTTPIYDGSFVEALDRAYQQARMLVVVLVPPPKKTSSATETLLQSVLSSAVAKVAEQPGRRKSRKKGTAKDRGNYNYKSYHIWTAQLGSPEAALAISRIKGGTLSTPKQRHQPMLLIVHPAPNVSRRTGGLVISPQLLAQHHCNPPLSPASKLAAWLKTLRKRHVKLYGKLQRHVQELQWQTERTRLYQSSMVEDETKARQEQRAQEEQRQRDQAQQEHVKRIEHRRSELLASLPAEPPLSSATASSGVTTVALRFATSGQTSQRRFATDTARLVDIFNWIDATFQIEREHVVLQTMNGKEKYEWPPKMQLESVNDGGTDELKKTLGDLQWGRTIALRVIVQTDKADATASATTASPPGNTKTTGARKATSRARTREGSSDEL